MNNQEWFSPKEKLPEIGQRVNVLLIKELIYMGNEDQEESDWKYDGEGFHGIVQWQEIQK